MYQLPVQGQGPVVIHSKTFTFWNAASSPRSVFFCHHQPPISGSFLEGLTEQKLTNLAQGDLAYIFRFRTSDLSECSDGRRPCQGQQNLLFAGR